LRIPRDISAQELIKLLGDFGYTTTRQTGSHIRITTIQNGEHHITIPNHRPIKTGTLNAILSETAMHFKISKNDLICRLFS
jgi:predicted RNA binding protein YcfA (HicA-like mRNA interferase family)